VPKGRLCGYWFPSTVEGPERIAPWLGDDERHYLSENLYKKNSLKKVIRSGFDKLVEHIKGYTRRKWRKIWSDSQPLRSGDQSDLRRSLNPPRSSQGINSLDQHINGFSNNRALAILHAITGNYDIVAVGPANPFYASHRSGESR